MRHDGDARVVAGGTRPAAVAAAVAAARLSLAGEGPAIEPADPRSTDGPAQAEGPGRPTGPYLPRRPAPAGAAVVLRTSGSTGNPRRVALAADALLASARATHARLGGPGAWLLALPVHHVAGWQVLVRSVVAHADAGLPPGPTVLDTTDGFRPTDLPAAVAAMPDDAPRYTALVPTQVARVLDDRAAVAALARLDAVLVGGAAAPPALLRRAREAGISVVTTYGMTETGGGCVYDGVPLDGVAVAEVDGLIEIAGPTLALGYAADDGALLAGAGDAGAFLERSGRRWFRTADLGRVAEGRVEVLGRADDVIITGGVNVHPAAVERALAGLPGVEQVVVVGVPDPEWGSLVTAVVVTGRAAPPPTLDDARHAVSARLGRAHAPRAMVAVDHLPLRGPGKVDRAAAAALAAGILAGR